MKRERFFTCFLFLGIFLLSGLVLAQQSSSKEGIAFISGDFNKALKLSAGQHKPVFIDAYAVWCAPCKQLKNETFKDKKIKSYFETHFINLSIDVEKGDGLKLADQYDINSYPTLLFVDASGKIIKKIEGFVDAKTLAAYASEIK